LERATLAIPHVKFLERQANGLHACSRRFFEVSRI